MLGIVVKWDYEAGGISNQVTAKFFANCSGLWLLLTFFNLMLLLAVLVSAYH
jgi:hypothetical protein